jgi:hypothetical protein
VQGWDKNNTASIEAKWKTLCDLIERAHAKGKTGAPRAPTRCSRRSHHRSLTFFWLRLLRLLFWGLTAGEAPSRADF